MTSSNYPDYSERLYREHKALMERRQKPKWNCHRCSCGNRLFHKFTTATALIAAAKPQKPERSSHD